MIDHSRMTSSTNTELGDVALALLRKALPQRVFTADDEGYDEARAGFGETDQPAPHLVVMATSSDDVVTAVNFARAQQLPIGVKATGHNFAFPYQHGMMISTERMQDVTINPEQRTARVAAGVRWSSVVPAAHEHGLAPLNGSVPHVGVVGYSLFGGFGWLLRKYGAAVGSIVAAELVTADGQLRRVSETEEPDLFWALRGANGNFGIVTALEFKLYPVSQIYGGVLFFPLEHAQEVLTAYSRWTTTVPDELTSSVALVRLPPPPTLPEALRGRAVITVRAAFVGSEADGAQLLQPLRALDGMILDTFQLMPYTEAKTISNDPVKSVAVRRSTMMLRELPAETIDTLVRMNGVDASTPVATIEIRQLGAMTRVAPHTTAFSQRYAPFLMQTIALKLSPEQALAAERNTAAIVAALQPFSTGGVLPSWLGDGDYGVERMRAGFTPEHYEQLRLLKRRYDSGNLFRLNHNIPPAQS